MAIDPEKMIAFPHAKRAAFGKSSTTSAEQVVRQYRARLKFTRSVSGDADLKTKNITLSLFSTIMGCIVSVIIQSVALNSTDWGIYSIVQGGDTIFVALNLSSKIAIRFFVFR